MIKLTLNGDRRITKIEADGFAITLNGRTNQEYKAALAPLGVELQFVEEVKESGIIPKPVFLTQEVDASEPIIDESLRFRNEDKTMQGQA